MLSWTRGNYGLGLAMQHIEPGQWGLGLAFIACVAVLAIALCGLAQNAGLRAVRLCGGLGLALTAAAVGYLGWRGPRPDLDAMEHLHAAWLMAQGQVPYVDFWQHHAPVLWILLAPVLGAMTPSATVLDLARLVSLGLSACAIALAVAVAQRLHGTRTVSVFAFVLCLATVVPCELNSLRPDLLANVLCLGAVLVLMRPWRARTSLASGVLLGLAAACHLRGAYLLAALPLAALSDLRRLPRGLALTAAHWAGAALGLLPLALWLQRHGLVQLYLDWVVHFNGSLDSRPGGVLPLLPVALVVAWWVRVRADRWGDLGDRERLVSAAIGLGVLQFVTMVNMKFVYHEQLILLTGAAVGAEEARRLWAALLSARRPAVAGALVGVLFLPTAIGSGDLLVGGYDEGKREIATLIALCGQQPVVTVPSGHPIFAPDATDLSQPWQFNWWLERPEIRARLRGMASRVIAARPALVLEYVYGPPAPYPTKSSFVNRLLAAHTVTPQEGARLARFLLRGYNLISIGQHRYWVRQDRPIPPEVTVLRRAGLNSPDAPPLG